MGLLSFKTLYSSVVSIAFTRKIVMGDNKVWIDDGMSDASWPLFFLHNLIFYIFFTSAHSYARRETRSYEPVSSSYEPCL